MTSLPCTPQTTKTETNHRKTDFNVSTKQSQVYYIFSFNCLYFIAECQELEIADSLLYCMNAKHVEIKKGVCDIVKQICNLEPDCQEFFTNRRFIFALLSIVDNHKDDDFVSRALDALIGR